MILISHRGNTSGKNPERENSPEYILESLEMGYSCEIDLWYKDDLGWYLGHDYPQYKIDESFLQQPDLWIHTKNIAALSKLTCNGGQLNYFWHQEDDYVLTSQAYIWTYPGRSVIPDSKSICVLPEINNQDVTNFYGICSDFIEDFR